MTLRAMPQINGNRREDFEAAYLLLRAAHEAVEKAHRSFMSDVANWRNYQHLAGATDICCEDRQRVGEQLQQAQRLIGAVTSDLVDVLEPTKAPTDCREYDWRNG